MSKAGKRGSILKWLGFGCLGALLLMGGCSAAVVVGVFSLMRNSEPYKDAVQIAAEYPQVVESIGTPIEPGWWTQGNIEISVSTGVANLTIPLNGPQGSGQVIVEGTKQGGEWTYQTLIFVHEGERINLLTE